jgi:hypothetical protein
MLGEWCRLVESCVMSGVRVPVSCASRGSQLGATRTDPDFSDSVGEFRLEGKVGRMFSTP